MTNVNLDEIAKFSAAAAQWWDTQGELRTLHQINPLRLDYIQRYTTLTNKRVIDVGCGGGILSEALAKANANVTAIDMSTELVNIAKQHANEQQLDIDYQQTTVESIAAIQADSFDIVTCMEMLEHVPQPDAVVKACATLCKPGGQIFFSTINRNPKSFLLAIVAAEHIMKLVPRGTHQYAEFIKPSELAKWSRNAGLQLNDVSGIRFNPFSGHHKLSRDVDVNYLLHVVKPL